MAWVGIDLTNNLAEPRPLRAPCTVTGDLAQLLGQGHRSDKRYFVTVADERIDLHSGLLWRQSRCSEDRHAWQFMTVGAHGSSCPSSSPLGIKDKETGKGNGTSAAVSSAPGTATERERTSQMLR